MPNWIVAAHGWGKRKTSTLRTLLAPTKKFKYGVTIVPPAIELVVYTPQNSIMGMNWGWQLWFKLAYNLNGGEDAAYAQRHKRKAGGSIVPDYRTTGDNSFPTGVFEVGCCSDVPTVLPIREGDIVPLSRILKRAWMTRGVKRVYWLCCTQLDLSAPMYEI